MPAAVVTEIVPDRPAAGTVALIRAPWSSTLKAPGTPPKPTWDAPSRPLPVSVTESPARADAGLKEARVGIG